MLHSAGARVLIIDDQPDDTDLATEALRDIGPEWVVEIARSAEEGLRRADQASWTLILLDHQLPRKGGLEILPLLRRRAPDASIVMLTAHGDERVAVEAMRGGADYYLPKSSGFLVALPLVVREVLEKRHLRSTLARAEDRYRRLLEHVADVVYDLDGEGRFQYVSAAVQDALGYAPEEVVGQHYSRFLHPDDLPSCGRQFHERRTGARATRQLAVRLLAKSGEARDFEVSAAGVYDDHRFLSTAGLARDVTEKRRAEEAARRSRDFVLKLFDQFPALTWRSGPDGGCDYFNRAWLQFTGRTMAQELGDGWAQGVHPEDLHRVLRVYREAFRDREPFEMEYRLRRRDGVYRWIFDRGCPFTDPHGQFAGYVGCAYDVTDRREMEQALRESEERFRELANAAHDVFWTSTPQLDRCLYASPAYETIWGRPLQSLYDRFDTFFEAIHPDDRERVRANLVGTAQSPADGFEIEYRIVRPDGTVRWIWERGFPIRNEAGQVYRMAGIAQDITERKRTADAVRESEERFRQLAENIEQVFWMTTPDKRRMLYVSPAYEAIWGRSRESLYESPLSWVDAIHPDDRARVGRAALTEQCQGEYSETYRVLRPDGACRWVLDRAFPVLDESGAVVRLVGVAEDITEQVRAQQALQAKTDEVQAIGDAMTLFLEGGEWRAAGAQLLRAALRQTGSEYGFIGIAEAGALQILVHEGIRWDDRVNRAFYEEAIRTFETVGHLEIRNLDNLLGVVLTTGAAVVANDPSADPRSGGLPPGHPPLHSFLGVPILRGAEVVGMIGMANRPDGYTDAEQALLQLFCHATGVLYDSSRRRLREHALEGQLRQAQKLEAVGRLAGGIAHDFNNLLTPILGYGKRLARRLPEGGDDAREANLIVHSAARAAEITAQLLVFGRQQVASLRVVDVNHQLRAIESLLRAAVGEHIALEVRPGKDLRRVRVDPGQLDQVVLNLALNARDAMPRGGTLSLSCDNAIEAMTSHPAFKRGTYVRLTVKDNGVGMSEDVLARIFEPFYSTKEVGKGTGLGLAIVDGIVKQAGGFVEVYSLVNWGTAVHVFLPATDESAPPDQGEGRTRSGHDRGTETILLVEDDRAVRNFLAQALRSLGYTVLEAGDGEEAVRLVERHDGPLDLLLSDVVMPRMNGWELVRILRRCRPDLPVLLMSGYPSRDGAEKDETEDGEELLRKPFAGDDLAQRVRSLLDRRKGPS